VSYLLRMSGEIHDWLTDLRGSDPPAAILVRQALAALMSEGASLGSQLVAAVDPPRPEELVEVLDSSYQERTERLQAARWRAYEAAVLVKDIQDHLAELESARETLDDRRRRALAASKPEEAAEAADKLAAAQQREAEARQLLPRAIEAERRLRDQQQRLQARTEAFRTRKEVLKATYTLAHADLLVDEAMSASGQSGDDPSQHQHDSAEAAAKLRDVTGEMERELNLAPWPDGLMELRPGAPDDSQIRIIFAVEPPGTALLIAVLEGHESVRDHYREAIRLAADVLRRARAGQAPEASARGYDDTRSFLEEFHSGDAGEALAGAATLAARNRARSLAEQRTRLGLTQAEVAQRMGVSQERVSAIEHAEPGATEVRTLAGYVEALGGRLGIIAEFGGERVPLR
jgi:phage shock protein A